MVTFKNSRELKRPMKKAKIRLTYKTYLELTYQLLELTYKLLEPYLLFSNNFSKTIFIFCFTFTSFINSTGRINLKEYLGLSGQSRFKGHVPYFNNCEQMLYFR